ncbi:hypothetical protein GCM10009104_13690 [Marinobacterium maritimum]|uniref:Flagellar protein FliT n=1 Tax=Marinobacterium maritimum TaxID=500162 RepID=A0ABN1I4X5_9GAMM
MKPIIEHALSLLQATRALKDCVATGELHELEALQQQRAQLVAALDQESRQPLDENSLRQVRPLIEQSRQLEAETVALLEQQREQTSQEYNKLSARKKARQAYGGL